MKIRIFGQDYINAYFMEIISHKLISELSMFFAVIVSFDNV